MGNERVSNQKFNVSSEKAPLKTYSISSLQQLMNRSSSGPAGRPGEKLEH